MGLKEMQILFDNPWATYYSGSKVSGRLILNIDSPKKVREVTVKFKGEAQVRWTEVESHRDSEGRHRDENVDYTSNEVYFENKFVLLGSGGNELSIPAGTHNYDFSTILPLTIPSSYEGQYGYIRYTAKVTLNRPWKFDQECKSAFTVITPVDLNYSMEARQPLYAEKEKSVGILCCQSGPLAGRIKAPLSGYVSGQTIPLTVEVENMTNTNVTSGYCSLQKVVTYVAVHPSRRVKAEQIEITRFNLSAVGAHGTNSWTNSLTIPALPATNTQCPIISIAYQLMLDTSVSGLCYRGLTLTTPLLIGNIPLVSVNASQPVPAVQPNLVPESLYPELPPPTYEESTHGQAKTIQDKDDSEHTLGIGGWTPRYPTFNYNPSAPPAEFS